MAQLTETHRICLYQLSDKCPKKQYKVTLEASKNRLKFLHNCESLTDIRINFFTRIMHYLRDMIFLTKHKNAYKLQ